MLFIIKYVKVLIHFVCLIIKWLSCVICFKMPTLLCILILFVRIWLFVMNWRGYKLIHTTYFTSWLVSWLLTIWVLNLVVKRVLTFKFDCLGTYARWHLLPDLFVWHIEIDLVYRHRIKLNLFLCLLCGSLI